MKSIIHTFNMKTKKFTAGKIITAMIIAACLAACNGNNDKYDASGTFETDETIISAEGQELKAGQYIGYIDSVQLYLKKKQLEAQIKTTLSQRPDIAKQLSSLQAELKAAEVEQKRISNLLKSDAATQKQMDDMNARVDVLKNQIAAQQSSLGITTDNINQQANPLQVQIDQVNNQLEKCRIINNVNGTVLTKYAETNEMASSGKALYKIADLSSLILRGYITGNQLSNVKLGQQVKVLVDDKDGKYKEYNGTIEWISNKAEFTPKTIQTKDERADLVYAVKIGVKNDGYLKIGMYADIKF
jgi:membrane fusion protein YbhG